MKNLPVPKNKKEEKGGGGCKCEKFNPGSFFPVFPVLDKKDF